MPNKHSVLKEIMGNKNLSPNEKALLRVVVQKDIEPDELAPLSALLSKHSAMELEKKPEDDKDLIPTFEEIKGSNLPLLIDQLLALLEGKGRSDDFLKTFRPILLDLIVTRISNPLYEAGPPKVSLSANPLYKSYGATATATATASSPFPDYTYIPPVLRESLDSQGYTHVKGDEEEPKSGSKLSW